MRETLDASRLKNQDLLANFSQRTVIRVNIFIYDDVVVIFSNDDEMT